MGFLADLLLGVWVGAVTFAAFAMLPALALGKAPRRSIRWPELVGGAAWSMLAAMLLVPPLAGLRLLNWTTALLIPLAWPLALWLYRYRGAPSGEFREQRRRVILCVLTGSWRRPRVEPRHVVRAVAFAAGVAALYWLAARELRLPSPSDYDSLAHARALQAGGRWIADPAASLAAIVSRLAAVDAMQAMRFLRAFSWPGSLVAGLVATPSLNASYAWTAVLAALALSIVAVDGTHRRDPWHVVAACSVAALAFSAPGVGAGDSGGHVEYDAAARQALAIAHTYGPIGVVLAAPPEQRVELTDSRQFLPLADFVRRFADRAGERTFRFDVPARHLFVFAEKTPLSVPADAALAPVGYAPLAHPYRLANARATLERRAIEVCEAYRRTHGGVSVDYEDAELRIYHIRH